MKNELTLGSLFDGSGGFPLGGILAGITPLWASEIEPFAVRITTKRLPQATSWQTVSPLPGECLTHNTGECPRGENASSLSQILIANAPEKYCLSPKACRGILQRASKRGKELPPLLKAALERQAQSA